MLKTIGNFESVKMLYSIDYIINRAKTNGFHFILILLLGLTRCANPVSPTGGPKDTDPPVIEECVPPNFSTQFTADKFEIKFDEFVQLKDANNQVVISPPYLPNTEYRLRGKSVVVAFDDSLKSNTTYSIHFGDAISDNTEGNLLENFSYVFSTGDYIDSLSLHGTVIDAFDLTPQKGIQVMLYMDNNDTVPFDSLPYKVKPYYLARTNEKGEFYLGNISSNEFKFFALKDQNGDFIYNLPEEKIAFVDSLVRATYEFIPAPDTTAIDSVVPSDSLKPAPLVVIPGLTVRLFQQYDSIQKLLKSTVVQEGELSFVFRYPSRKPQFKLVNVADTFDWKVEEYTRKRDTVFLWLKNINIDSLHIKVTENDVLLDTIRFNLKEKSKAKKADDKDKPVIKRLSITSNVRGSALNQFKSYPVLIFGYPLAQFSFAGILLVEGKDTLQPTFTVIDSVKRYVKINHKWKEDKRYSLVIPDSLFYSINGLTHDSVTINFRSSMEREYGLMQLSINLLTHPEGNYVVQLLDDKSVVLEEQRIHASGKVQFSYLPPKKYKIKAIYDKNNNGRWDTGNYLQKIEPEEVFFYPKVLEVRANWEVEEPWDL